MKNYNNLSVEEMWDILIDNEIATEDECQLITSINGYNEESLLDILYVRTGNRTFEQLANEYEWDDDDEDDEDDAD